MSRLTPHPDCPECAQGKHVNCTHEVLATDGDYWVTCGCRNRNHQDPPQ
jgi:hypothetical protein